jgi:hypothetical protein
MIKVKPLLILLITLTTVNNLYCQKIFRDGYIVRKTGESITGLVEYSINQSVPSSCTFKRFEIAHEVEYTPRDIQAFGYKNGNRYESKEFNSKISFYEVIVSGKIVLYMKGSKFYIDKNNSGLTELNNGPVSYSAGGQKTEYKNLAEFLRYLTEGKTDIPYKISLKDNLIPLIVAFNKDTGQSFHVFNRSMSEKDLGRIALESGTNKNTFGILSGINIYKLNLTNNSERYLPGPENEICPVNGLTFERSLSRNNDRLSVRLDLLYLKQTFYCYDEGADYRGITRNDAFFDFTGIKAPLLIQYSFTGRRMVPYVNAGLAYQYIAKHSFLHIEDVENSQHEISTYEYEDFHFKPNEISAVGGLGLRTRLFNNFYLNIQGRIELGSGLFVNSLDNKMKLFKQNSIQSTFLLGITF